MEINIYNEYGNIIIFPNLLFLILAVIIGVCAYKMKKYSSDRKFIVRSVIYHSLFVHFFSQ